MGREAGAAVVEVYDGLGGVGGGRVIRNNMREVMDLNFWGMVLQALGLSLAAVRDLTKKHAEKEDEKIRTSQFVEIFQASLKGDEYEESTQEKVARKMTEFAQKFDVLLPYSIAIAVVGTLMQIAEELLK